jgi:hypothetical protein
MAFHGEAAFVQITRYAAQLPSTRLYPMAWRLWYSQFHAETHEVAR